ncbi:hypothetical protein GCM10011390_43590 [Aureimonas endophytica]|uniref:Uncharacterized protein n=1 Tax=Aureimonas endophytica TaxID=2027858 RepID=A0A916ZZI7_9HYPH|nr:hypothetical protein [Aureimonas endophytica]GGE19635.1 hypothetical protein GCM10011390_43590 [Aureimonas endophytica]
MTRLDPQDARQGRKGTPVLRILIAAMILVVIAGAGMAVYGYFMPDQTLPKAETGGGLTPPAPDSAQPAPSGSVVTPQTSGPSSSGDTAN